jgi:hypothetical protein
MPENQSPNLTKVPTEVLMNYYDHQYDRMGKLEDQRTAITNITITLSVLALTFGFSSATGFARVVAFSLLTVMILANLFAITYIVRTNSWIQTHELRAKGILTARFNDLREFDRQTHAKYGRWALSRWKIQMYLHILLLVLAVAMMALFAVYY